MTEMPDIVKECPFIEGLFVPENVDKQINVFKEQLSKSRTSMTYGEYKKKLKKQLVIFLDWKKVLNNEMSLEEYNDLHQLTDLI